jgi:hypothetical protein
VPSSEAEDSVFAQLQGMFAVLALGKATFVSPSKFWHAFKDYDGSPIDIREHQDAYEFFTRLQVFGRGLDWWSPGLRGRARDWAVGWCPPHLRLLPLPTPLPLAHRT